MYTISICGSANSSKLELGTSEVAQVQGGAAQLQGPHHLIIIRLFIFFLFIGIMEGPLNLHNPSIRREQLNSISILLVILTVEHKC